MMDPLDWNKGVIVPTPEHPLYFVYRGDIPSLKNERNIGVTKKGRVFSNPKQSVTQAIAGIRDSLARQLPKGWEPIKSPQLVCLWMVLGAYGVSSIPDKDADNMGQTVQEALAMPRNKDKINASRRDRLVVEDDKQVVSPHTFRRQFTDAARIYHEIYVWVSSGTNKFTDIAEYYAVSQLIKRNEYELTSSD